MCEESAQFHLVKLRAPGVRVRSSPLHCDSDAARADSFRQYFGVLQRGTKMTRKSYVPDGVFDSRDYGFAQVVVVATPYGDAVHVSGQVAWDADQRIVGDGDVGRQLNKSLENLAVV